MAGCQPESSNIVTGLELGLTTAPHNPDDDSHYR